MEILAALSVAVLILSALSIATRTFMLWRRSRQLPELLLSLMLFSVTVIGYPLAVACTVVPATKLLAIHLAFPVAMNGGFVCLLLFTLQVFRPGVAWAACLVGATVALLGASAVSYMVEATSANPRNLTQLVELSLFNSAGVVIAYFWTTFESLACYRRLRLRLRLGLTEPAVVDRVLLWGLMTLTAGGATVFNMVTLVTGSLLSAPMVAISSVLGLFHAGFLLLAFAPPGWYREWVEQRYAVESA